MTITLGNRVIVSHVDIAVERGAFIGVLGPNGAGKTTLMRAILGLIVPAGGRVHVLGAPVKSAGNRLIGYMPQTRNATASIRLSGWDFVASGVRGSAWGLPFLTAAEQREIAWALEMVGAMDLSKRPISDMSGGERQRLHLAQALLGRPRILLLDEPLINLDPHHQRTVVDLVERIRQELGTTVLFSAHELNPLLNVLDKVLYLGHGRVALGSVDEVITAPILSSLYGSPIEVLRVDNRIFVMSGEYAVEGDAHRHEEGDHA